MAEGMDRFVAWMKASAPKLKAAAVALALAPLAYCFPVAAMALVGTFLSALAVLIYPAFFVKTIEIDIDDVVSWGGKGPAAQEPGFPKHLAAPYYLDGNIMPDQKLSGLCIMDLTYCKYDATSRTMTFDSQQKFGFIAGTDCHDDSKKAAFGTNFFKMLACFGMAYNLVWDDKFETCEVKIRTTRFNFSGGTYPLFPDAWYRWWIADVKPDGSAFKRHTSFGGRLNPGKDLFDGVPLHSCIDAGTNPGGRLSNVLPFLAAADITVFESRN